LLANATFGIISHGKDRRTFKDLDEKSEEISFGRKVFRGVKY
jgi:hypothetical protein